MNFTDIFIKRPVLAIVVNLIIIIAGVQAIWSLNVRQYPESENASVKITTTYVGANPELVRGFVTTPLERAIAAADGIDYIESTSAQNVSTITARLRLNYDSNRALSEISSKVDKVRGDLPEEAEVPIIEIEVADSSTASSYLSFTSDVLEQNEITDYLVRVVQPRLSSLEGVQRADILGARTFAMRIWLKPDKMASLGLSPADVRAVLSANNYLSAVGETKGQLVSVDLTANTDLQSAEEFRQMVVREEGGSVVRLGDIADVVLGAESYDAEVRFTGQTAVFMGIWVLPNANALDVIARVRTEMADIQAELPTGMEAGIAYDSTRYIEDAISEVITTLTETLIIVVIVIFLFLGSLRSVLIPIIAIPISLIGAVFLMQVFGFSVNLLTLLAVVLSVGLVVDDAIVMVENIERHLREGKKPFDAAILGARELRNPIIAMTITLAAVYAPIGLQGGLTGSLFREFAFTLAGAVAISGIVALTLSPVMSSRLLRAEDEQHWLPAHINAGFEKLKSLYRRVLDVTLAARVGVYIFWVGITLLAGVFYLYAVNFVKELAPQEDQGVIFGIVNAAPNATVDYNTFFAEEINDIYMSLPETSHTFQLTQPTGGFSGMALKPWSERDRTVFEVFGEVQQRLPMVTGLDVFPVMPSPLPSGGQFPVEMIITSTAEPQQILTFAQEIQQHAMKSGKFVFPPIIDLKVDNPQVEIVFDRDKVADLGLNMQQVGIDLASALGGNFVNRFNIDGRSYKVIAQIKRAERLNPEQLENLYVTGPNGQPVALSTFASLKETVEPRSLGRFQQLNAVKLSGVPIGPLDGALQVLEDKAREVLPRGYNVDYTGESRQLREEGNTGFLVTFALAMALIFLVLSAQFNSFRDPLVILLGSVPLAMFGALLFVFLKIPAPVPFWTEGWTTTFNIYAQVGLVTLIGLVAKNGILIVEFANVLQHKGKSKLDAVKEAALTRLRPVLMTSVATVVGHFPLVLVSGAGAEARNSIGLIVVAGMAIGSVLTLVVIPSIYMLIARDHSKDDLSAQQSEILTQ